MIVAGGREAKAAGDALEALLDGLPDVTPALAQQITPDCSPRRILLHDPTARVTNLAFLGPLPPTEAGAELEDLILIHALGGNDQSVLFNAVRTELRASYGFNAGIANYTRDHRFFYMAGEVETAKLADAERVVREAYGSFRQAGTLDELAERKTPFATSFTKHKTF